MEPTDRQRGPLPPVKSTQAFRYISHIPVFLKQGCNLLMPYINLFILSQVLFELSLASGDCISGSLKQLHAIGRPYYLSVIAYSFTKHHYRNVGTAFVACDYANRVDGCVCLRK